VSGFEDWLPTLLDVVGASATVPGSVDGISLLPTLLGKPQVERDYLYREFPSYGGQQTIRVGNWKAVRQNMFKGNLEVELYNLANDVSESRNIASEHPDVVAKLTEMMSTVRTASTEFPLVPIDPKPSSN
jgi:arylsulfatase